jgi:hypothetical protein
MTTLENSYTVPMTLDELVQCVPWLKDDPMAEDVAKCAFVAFGDGTIAKEPRDGMAEIPVPKFIDLLNDRITPWRLEEVGFFDHVTQFIGLFGSSHIHFTKSSGSVTITPFDHGKGINVYPTTFTDLLTLIRSLTPNTNKP